MAEQPVATPKRDPIIAMIQSRIAIRDSDYDRAPTLAEVDDAITKAITNLGFSDVRVTSERIDR